MMDMRAWGTFRAVYAVDTAGDQVKVTVGLLDTGEMALSVGDGNPLTLPAEAGPQLIANIADSLTDQLRAAKKAEESNGRVPDLRKRDGQVDR